MISKLQELSTDQLTSLTVALRTGRLNYPFSITSLAFITKETLAESVALELKQFVDQGIPVTGLASLLHILADEKTHHVAAQEHIDLILTSPNASGSAQRTAISVIRNLFSHAKKSVVIVGYAVNRGAEFFKELAMQMDKLPQLRVLLFVNIRRYYDDPRDSMEIVSDFKQRFISEEWPGTRIPELYFDPRSLSLEPSERSSLHAKCIIIDGMKLFISSTNLTDDPQQRNIEVGTLIRSQQHAMKVIRHFMTLRDKGFFIRVE